MFIFNNYLIFVKINNKYQLILFSGDSAKSHFDAFIDNAKLANYDIFFHFTFKFMPKNDIYLDHLFTLLHSIFGPMFIVYKDNQLIKPSLYKTTLNFFQLFRLFDHIIEFDGILYFFSGRNLKKITIFLKSYGIILDINPKHNIMLYKKYAIVNIGLKQVEIFINKISIFIFIQLLCILIKHYKK